MRTRRHLSEERGNTLDGLSEGIENSRQKPETKVTGLDDTVRGK